MINSDNFMLVEDGAPLADVEFDGLAETYPHGKTAIGMSFQFTDSDTKLSGIPESNNILDLPDTVSERRFPLDSYSHYGHVPFTGISADNWAFEFTPSLFWINPSDMF
jgi:alpha 1,3-glucosidase